MSRLKEKIVILKEWLSGARAKSLPRQETKFLPGVTYVRWTEEWVSLDVALHDIQACSETSLLIPHFEHHSGYVREAAIKRAGMNNTTAIAPLIDRLNDWVPKVRVAAGRALKYQLVEANAALFVALLPAFRNLQKRGRDQHDLIVTEIENFLRKPENIGEVVKGLRSSDIKVARECYALVAEADALPTAECARYAIRSNDLIIAKSAMSLAPRLSEIERNELIDEGLRSPFTPVRSTALLALLRSLSDAKMRIAREMLFDRHAMVREIAWEWLSEQGENIEAHYSAVLEDQQQPYYKARCALWAASKLRLVSALPAIRRMTQSPSSRIRSSAVLVLAKLDPASVPQLVELALNGASTGAIKVAALLARYHDAVIRYANLQPLLNNPGRVDEALQIARYQNKWDWIAVIFELALTRAGDKQDKKIANELLRWINQDTHGFSNPDPQQTNRLSGQVQRGVLDKFEGGYKERIAFILKCSGVAP